MFGPNPWVLLYAKLKLGSEEIGSVDQTPEPPLQVMSRCDTKRVTQREKLSDENGCFAAFSHYSYSWQECICVHWIKDTHNIKGFER